MEWYQHGYLHREDGPAYESADGYKKWVWLNKLHREDGPAVEYPNGDQEWYRHGKLHREDGPAVELRAGDKLWYVSGKLIPSRDVRQHLMSHVDLLASKNREAYKNCVKNLFLDEY